jgi:uncharacterized protein YndB with AHSA1/START domain
MGDMRIIEQYPWPRPIVWRALTAPELVPLWTSTGQGGRPEGFDTAVGTKFMFIGRPFPGWDGVVRCEVLEVEEPRLLRYDWRNKESDEPTVVTYLLDEIPAGTRLIWEHAGFRGIDGAFMSRLLTRVRRKMLSVGLPTVLADLDEQGNLLPESRLRPQG